MDAQTSDVLLKEWKVSHEEGQRPELILRPSTYDFPLSRFRDEFIFKKDNVLIYNTLGPADRPLTKKGTWEWEDENTLKLVVDELNTFYWKIEELKPNVFKVTQLNK